MAMEQVSLGRVRGFGVFMWDLTADVVDVSQILGAQVNDSIVNTGATTVIILGVSVEVGGVVRVISATEGVLVGNVGGFNVFTWNNEQDLADISEIPGAKIGDSVINTGTKTVNMLGRDVEVGGILRISWDGYYVGVPMENSRGFGIHTWSADSTVVNISQILGARLDDYVVNTGTTAVNILGINTEVGEIVRIISSTAGTGVQNIEGAKVFLWNTICAVIHISQVEEARLGDFIINTGESEVTIFGTQTSVDGVVKISLNEAYVEEPIGNIRGFGMHTWSVATALDDISQVVGMRVNDLVINTGTAIRNILGVSAEIGGVVRATTATTGAHVGSVRGPQGDTGPQGPLATVIDSLDSRSVTNPLSANQGRLLDERKVDRVNKRWAGSDWSRVVIGLCLVQPDNNPMISFSTGRLVRVRSTGVNQSGWYDVNILKRWNSQRPDVSLLNVGNNILMKPCTFMFNGQKWAGLEYSFPSAFEELRFTGETTVDIFTMAYARMANHPSTPNAIVNAEINNSLDFTDFNFRWPFRLNDMDIPLNRSHSQGSIALGGSAQAIGTNSVALGNDARASAGSSVAIGLETRASGANSVVLGSFANTGFFNTICIGNLASATNANQITLGDSRITQLRCNAGTISALSDSRIKENVQLADTEICLEDVRRLPVSRFKYKDYVGTKLDKTRTGFMADDVEKVFPKAVQEADEWFPELDENGDEIYIEERDEAGNIIYEEPKFIEVEELDADGNIIIVKKENPDCKPHMVVKKFMIEKVKTIANEVEIPTLWGAVQELAKQFDKSQEENAKLAKQVEELQREVAELKKGN